MAHFVLEAPQAWPLRTTMQHRFHSELLSFFLRPNRWTGLAGDAFLIRRRRSCYLLLIPLLSHLENVVHEKKGTRSRLQLRLEPVGPALSSLQCHSEKKSLKVVHREQSEWPDRCPFLGSSAVRFYTVFILFLIFELWFPCIHVFLHVCFVEDMGNLCLLIQSLSSWKNQNSFHFRPWDMDVKVKTFSLAIPNKYKYLGVNGLCFLISAFKKCRC